MKEVTRAVVEKANDHAARTVEEAYARAKADGRELAPEIAHALHKGAWASITGADHVKVVG